VDVIDCAADRFLFCIPDLTAVAGVLVSEELGTVFSSNRGEDTIGVLPISDVQNVTKIKVGIRPNGLSIDPGRGLLLAANVGNPDTPVSHTLSIVDVERRRMIHSIPVAGRTRWTIFDPANECFFVNIADPFEIAVVESADPTRIARFIEVPARGPHGLDIDPASRRLFCACDAGMLYALDLESGKVLLSAHLSGAPDVIFFDAARKHLYVAVGEPGVIDVFETDGLELVETVTTGKGAHTLGFDAAHNKVYAFLPESHCAAVCVDE